MTLQQLKYIVTVAEAGNITEAAKRLFISQPSLTNAIRELEKEMQVTIFNRTNKGVIISDEGDVFLSYARQVLEQADLLEEKFLNKKETKPRFSVSCQHYSFAVNAFVDLIRSFDSDKYDFTLRETQTYEIIEDVSRMRSEIGILYTSPKNEQVLMKMMKQHELEFEELFVAKPHVFINSNHPLSKNKVITLEDLEDYPYLSFEQGDDSSFYFAEEILSTEEYHRTIKANDRATMLNLMIGLNGYTLCSGIICEELNGSDYIAVPFKDEDESINRIMEIGWITRKGFNLSTIGNKYIEEVKKYLKIK